MPLSCARDDALCLEKLCMKRVPLFAKLPERDLEQLAGKLVRREYPKGAVLLQAGVQADSIIIVNAGQAKACRYTADGKEQILYLFSEGDFFGEQSLFSDTLTQYRVEALTPVKTCRLYRTAFQDLIKAHPQLALDILAALNRRLASLENLVSLQDIDLRIHSFLLELADQYGQPQGDACLIQLPLSREGMANYLGIARETVSRKLKQLESEGLVQIIGNKSLLLPDPARFRNSLSGA